MCTLFRRITESIPTISDSHQRNPLPPTEAQTTALENAFIELADGIFSLSRLIKTPLFWKYLHHPSIIAWVKSHTVTSGGGYRRGRGENIDGVSLNNFILMIG
jgi:hypothetical protein